ncbi:MULTISPECIES: hypothetical protein [Parachlamydia]|jgi:hypothetical protein|uniref:Uncharacterized protein n=2 Tax=Parachlamydia acanthamoebae TaxID=83552 RepID=F8L204_PARAV|nr:hypothetical protein [Parachlamydia acanthamoebae]EFB40234.1 hypothetical protein pah_c221o024 [Parachlamydia acanthamoebae str. Hall's coccus]CCB87318.1 putative uncharacterized protein [Parachlamydia acanthamoebae UV-7]
MQKGNLLQFNCKECGHSITFSVFELEKRDAPLPCQKCHQKYALQDNVLKKQLKLFADLCQQLIISEEILSHTAVGIDIGEHHVKIPYKLLLTRLNSTLDLLIDGEPLSIKFLIEPLKEGPCCGV